MIFSLFCKMRMLISLLQSCWEAYKQIISIKSFSKERLSDLPEGTPPGPHSNFSSRRLATHPVHAVLCCRARPHWRLAQAGQPGKTRAENRAPARAGPSSQEVTACLG